MRIDEIELRLSAIKEEIVRDGADVDALSKESDELLAERTAILDAEQTRQATLAKVAQIPLTQGEKVKEDNGMEERFTIESAEYRSAWLKQVRGLELNEVEKRAYTSASNSAGAAIPTQTANEILRKTVEQAPLLAEVTLLHVPGGISFVVEGTNADAALHSENASISAAGDTLTKVTLSSYEIVKLVQASDTVMQMSLDGFEAFITDMLATKVANKIESYLVNGTGSSQPEGIEKAQTWGETNSVTVAASSNLAAADVQTLVGLLPGQYDKNAKFLMNKKTLFVDFMPLQDNSKHKLVQVEGKNYFIYGYPVIIDENVSAHEAFLGDFKKVVANLGENINVHKDYDINTNSFKFSGVAIFDSKVAIGEAIVKLVKAAASSGSN